MSVTLPLHGLGVSALRRRQALSLERQACALEKRQAWHEAADAWDVAGDVWTEAGDVERSARAYKQAWGRRRFGQDWATVRVVFRKFKDRGGEVFAVLPEVPWHSTFLDVTVFTAEGHTGAPYHALVYTSRPAKPEEYAPLAQTMQSIGYDVVPIRRWSRP